MKLSDQIKAHTKLSSMLWAYLYSSIVQCQDISSHSDNQVYVPYITGDGMKGTNNA